MKSNSQAVLEFAREAGRVISPVPRPLTKEETKFVVQMMASELVELAQTVCDDDDEAIAMVQEGARIDVSKYDRKKGIMQAADQADAVVDMWYYALDTFCRAGIDLSNVFDAVHAANMNKRWPDGTFHKREDGKIIKPPGWEAPDISSVISS